MAAPYLIHIGYQKTGSTWLQAHYFSQREAGFSFVREQDRTVEGGIGGRPPGWYIIEQPLFHYDPAAVRRTIDELFAADIAAGLIPVISNEQLSGNPASGGWQAKEYAWRLASSFPDARILIMVREQRTMLRSSYMQYLRGGGGMTLRNFMVAPQDFHVPQSDLYYFRYHHLLQHYLDLFPRERVLCLPYEQFRDQPDDFLARLDAFAGVSRSQAALPVGQRENAGEGMLQYPLWRVINPLIKNGSVNSRSPYAMTFLRKPAKRWLGRVSRLAPRGWDRALVRRWERQIDMTTAGFYEESNRILGGMIGLDLSRFGWRT